MIAFDQCASADRAMLGYVVMPVGGDAQPLGEPHRRFVAAQVATEAVRVGDAVHALWALRALVDAARPCRGKVHGTGHVFMG
jgi:hypothetical protein